ncbi:ABC transporter permease [Catenovulum adriaticum]|uniref:ABC transporter permease subunit n=1 Tax=Catenovulum adriaticum TaxID=2984846 RepID=A0ABY7ATJ2_9ALTE|nr:ABC transporter permease subunit [Catenovulum sp. TS8]WAJ71689.1 ABC transporter permease subunit [Catenovulum sp. TS8]
MSLVYYLLSALSRPVLLLLITLPVGAGLFGVVLPAFNYFPALGRDEFSLQVFQQLFTTPGLDKMLSLSLFCGLVSTLIAFKLNILILATFYQSRWLKRIEHVLSPVLAVPHAAAAIAIAFLLTPSGWFNRLISPWLTGSDEVTNSLLPNDPWGISIIIGLVFKELPFLLLMSLSVLKQANLKHRLAQETTVAVSLGLKPEAAFIKVLLPQIYPLIRLPILAVLAYASASVEIPYILGPNNPATLAVVILNWFNHSDLNLRFVASAAALLQTLVTLTAILLWLIAERLFCRYKSFLLSINLNRLSQFYRILAFSFVALFVIVVAVSLGGLLVWSFAGFWPYPDAWPQELTYLHWQNALTQLHEPILNSVKMALASSGLALLFSLFTLESAANKHKLAGGHWLDMLIYVPLLVPGVAFLFGLLWFQQAFFSEAVFIPVLLSHLIYVIPYVYLSLAVSYQNFNPALIKVAASLGAKPCKIFWRIKLPQMFAAIMVAFALGLAISLSQYLPTLLSGGGRYATLTTEAVALANGASRRTSAVYAILQMILPLLGFILAAWLPKLIFNPENAHKKVNISTRKQGQQT